MTIRFDNKVAIVTGAGNGLGRSYALGLAARGAKVLVNDLGVAVDGTGSSISAAEQVAQEIRAAGGEAMASGANVTKVDEVNQMVMDVVSKWGSVDLLVNNAGILRDKTFAKMPLEDFRLVVDVHLMGSMNCTKAVWNIMREQQSGTIIMTTSSTGLYGNFGQSNYSAAKMGLVGLMNTLHLEGAKYGIKVKAISPCAATRMAEGIISEEAAQTLTVDSVTAGLLFLASDKAPSRLILCAGGGGYSATRIYETEGIYLASDQQTPENVADRLDDILDTSDQTMFEQGFEQTMKFTNMSLANRELMKELQELEEQS